MAEPIPISPRLEEWAVLAGYSLTPGSVTDDGRALFWSDGGEVRHFVGANDSGWFVVTDSDRLGPEYYRFAAHSLNTIEKHFFGKFGEYIRSIRNFPSIHIPNTKEEVSQGFSIEYRKFEQVDRLALIDSAGTILAFSSADLIIGTMELVALSVYLPATVDDITVAFLSPDGSPLFANRR
jgi:hypothetical protein